MVKKPSKATRINEIRIGRATFRSREFPTRAKNFSKVQQISENRNSG